MHERPNVTPAQILARIERIQADKAPGQAPVPDAEAHRLRSIKMRKRIARRLRRIAAMQAELLTWRMLRRVKKARPGRSGPRAERRKRGGGG